MMTSPLGLAVKGHEVCWLFSHVLKSARFSVSDGWRSLVRIAAKDAIGSKTSTRMKERVPDAARRTRTVIGRKVLF